MTRPESTLATVGGQHHQIASQLIAVTRWLAGERYTDEMLEILLKEHGHARLLQMAEVCAESGTVFTVPMVGAGSIPDMAEQAGVTILDPDHICDDNYGQGAAHAAVETFLLVQLLNTDKFDGASCQVKMASANAAPATVRDCVSLCAPYNRVAERLPRGVSEIYVAWSNTDAADGGKKVIVIRVVDGELQLDTDDTLPRFGGTGSRIEVEFRNGTWFLVRLTN